MLLFFISVPAQALEHIVSMISIAFRKCVLEMNAATARIRRYSVGESGDFTSEAPSPSSKAIRLRKIFVSVFLAWCVISNRSDAAIEVDCGYVKAGERVKREAEVRNDSSTKLLVEKVETSCRCVLAESAPKELPPNESVKIELSLKAPDQAGLVKQHVTIDAVDSSGRHKRFRIEVFAIVPGAWSSSAVGVDFGNVKVDQEINRQMEIVYAGESRSIEPVFEHPDLDLRISRISKVEQKMRGTLICVYRYEVKLLGTSSRKGEIKGQITVKTKDNTLTILVKGRYGVKYVVTPETVFFGNVSAGNAKSRAVTVKSIDSRFSLRDVEMKTDTNAIEITKSSSNSSVATFKISYKASEEQGDAAERGILKAMLGEEILFEVSYLALRSN